MWFLMIFLAISSALLQAAIIPALAIFGGIFNLPLAILIILLFYGYPRQASIFLLISAIFLAIFSGLSLITFILPGFFLILIYFFLVSRRVMLRPSTLMSVPIFFIAGVFSDFIITLISHELSMKILTGIAADSIYLALGGAFIYFCVNRIYIILNPQILRERVKIKAL